VHSTPGEGSEFELVLPLLAPPGPADRAGSGGGMLTAGQAGPAWAKVEEL
jgi:hypothetical protein